MPIAAPFIDEPEIEPRPVTDSEPEPEPLPVPVPDDGHRPNYTEEPTVEVKLIEQPLTPEPELPERAEDPEPGPEPLPTFEELKQEPEPVHAHVCDHCNSKKAIPQSFCMSIPQLRFFLSG